MPTGVLSISLAAAILGACGKDDDDSGHHGEADADTDTDSDTDTDTDTDSLTEARALWDAAAIDDYQFVLEWLCFCDEKTTGPARLTVEGDDVVAATYLDDGSAVAASFRTETIDGLFDLLASAYSVDGASVTATFDAKLGYPSSAWIDYDPSADDDELGFEVWVFTEF
jgi:hypothetical protein